MYRVYESYTSLPGNSSFLPKLKYSVYSDTLLILETIFRKFLSSCPCVSIRFHSMGFIAYFLHRWVDKLPYLLEPAAFIPGRAGVDREARATPIFVYPFGMQGSSSTRSTLHWVRRLAYGLIEGSWRIHIIHDSYVNRAHA